MDLWGHSTPKLRYITHTVEEEHNTLLSLRSDHEQATFHVAALKVEFSSVVSANPLNTNHEDIIQSVHSVWRSVHSITAFLGLMVASSLTQKATVLPCAEFLLVYSPFF